MATDLSGSNYSETDASNNNAAPNGMPEGMAPSGVNDAWRQGMGAIKRAYDRDHAGSWATVGGTANAITLTYTTGPAAYVQGEKFAFKATAANTGATTVNVSGLGAKNVFTKSAAGPIACIGGEIQSGDLVEIEYDGTQFQLMSSVGRARSKIIFSTRSMTGTTGDVSYTGAGFMPRSALIIGVVGGDTTAYSSGSIDIVGGGQCIRNNGSTLATGSVALLLSRDGDATFQQAVWKSWDSDGLTLTWTKSGSPGAATMQVQIHLFA